MTNKQNVVIHTINIIQPQEKGNSLIRVATWMNKPVEEKIHAVRSHLHEVRRVGKFLRDTKQRGGCQGLGEGQMRSCKTGAFQFCKTKLIPHHNVNVFHTTEW